MNNGDLNTLKSSLSMLTGASDSSSGSPSMGGAPGYGGSDPGQRYSSYGMDAGDDDPMDLDLPEATDDFQSRVIDEVKNAIRPFFNNGQISKDDYREILKKCVPKVASSGEINPKKIGNLVGAYVKKVKGGRPK